MWGFPKKHWSLHRKNHQEFGSKRKPSPHEFGYPTIGVCGSFHLAMLGRCFLYGLLIPSCKMGQGAPKYPDYGCRLLTWAHGNTINTATWVCLKMGYTPNEIAIFHRDNDQQNHWVQWGTQHFQTNPHILPAKINRQPVQRSAGLQTTQSHDSLCRSISEGLWLPLKVEFWNIQGGKPKEKVEKLEHCPIHKR